MTYKIEVRFDANELTPDKLSSRDVGELIAAIQDMLEAIIERDNPTFHRTADDVIISLVGVNRGSSGFVMSSELDVIVQPAYTLATSAITADKYNILPVRSVEAIKTFRKVAKTYNKPLRLYELNGARHELAVVSPTTVIKMEEPTYIHGQATIYGFLTGVSGENPPRATLRLLNDTTFVCNVTEKDSLQVARQLGQRLYTEVGVRGDARWEYNDKLVLNYFLIEELTEFNPVPVEQALNSLYAIAGRDYDAIDDIDMLVNELRGRDKET